MPTKVVIPEGLECDYDMSHMEFRLQSECDVDASLAIGSLPPGQVLLAGRVLRRLVLVDNFDHGMTLLWIAAITFSRTPVQRGD